MFLQLFQLVPQTIEQGIIYSLAVLGFAIALRMLGYADLTLEGSFVLGGVITGLLLEDGSSPYYVIIFSFLGGATAGLFTAAQHCFLRITKLLSGIITLAILYTVNLRIQGQPNVSFYNFKTIFNSFSSDVNGLFVSVPIVIIFFGLCLWLFQTNFGLFLRATGENENVVRKAGFNKKWFILSGLALSNGLIAASGSLFSQYMGFSDINIGGGLIVIGLTSLIIGEIIIRPTNVKVFLIAVLIGSIACQLINNICLQVNLHPSDHKGIVGILLIILIFCRKKFALHYDKKTIGAEVF